MQTPSLSINAAQIGDAARVSDLARGLDVLTEDDLLVFAGISSATAIAWRKRGIGPKHIRVGRRYFYPRADLAEFMRKQAELPPRRRARSVKPELAA